MAAQTVYLLWQQWQGRDDLLGVFSTEDLAVAEGACRERNDTNQDHWMSCHIQPVDVDSYHLCS